MLLTDGYFVITKNALACWRELFSFTRKEEDEKVKEDIIKFAKGSYVITTDQPLPLLDVIPSPDKIYLWSEAERILFVTAPYGNKGNGYTILHVLIETPGNKRKNPEKKAKPPVALCTTEKAVEAITGLRNASEALIPVISSMSQMFDELRIAREDRQIIKDLLRQILRKLG